MVTETAPAKINLALHVRARRPDGYHELETLFAFLRHGDTVRIEPSDVASFDLTGPFGAALAVESDNLVTRAAAAFSSAFGGGPFAITLDKHLPIASGIGGGSAD
ncbi:MAG: 4-(cytidine 5'-diphospho)-2-C-methyl-D-erythritol kinase, partial [Sphingomonas sp.]|nr:4-(cytidine 5'-diphospho)-2-C-methyl-D-erythritol kinase [Sphingomonas sp.]